MGVQDRDWYWEEGPEDGRASTLGDRFDAFRQSRRRPSSFHPVAIFLAAVIGSAGAWITVHAYLEWRTRVALEEVMRAGNDAIQRVQQQLQQQQRESAAREQVRREQFASQEASKLWAARMRQEAEEAARKGDLAEVARKERAWARFYRKPPSCKETVSIECANGFIRAKREFDERFARGEL
jgi:hypothetical protein